MELIINLVFLYIIGAGVTAGYRHFVAKDWFPVTHADAFTDSVEWPVYWFNRLTKGK